jgi:uncharacterized protein DUF3800
MKIYVDESGSFTWNPSGVSLFCGISVADRSIPDLFVRFLRWKQEVPKRRRGAEVKGSSLSDSQLASFARKVIVPSESLFLTFVGTDTLRLDRAVVETHKQQAAEVLKAASVQTAAQRRTTLSRQYLHMAGWLSKRSLENHLWLICLEECTYDALQHTIVRFDQPIYDQEFERIEFVIDRSFIRRKEELLNSQELARNRILQLSLKRPIEIPNDWAPRSHPFVRKYVRHGLLEGTQLFRDNLYFADSKPSEGVQIADICVNICYRVKRYSKAEEAYDMLRPYIVGYKGAEIRIVLLTDESLWKDSAEKHVKHLDPAELLAERPH